MDEVFAGTVLAEILPVLAKGDFSALDLSKAKEGEQEVGELIGLEKAVFTLARSKADEAEKIVAEGKAKQESGPCEICQQLGLLQAQIKALGSFGWLLVKQRLNLWEEPSLGLRAGFKVVQVS